MQREKASGPFDAEVLAEDDALVDDPTFATPGLPELLPPLQAAASRARPAVAMMAAAVRTVRGRARRGRRMTRVLSFITPPSGLDDRAGRPLAARHPGRAEPSRS
jgi:hypothetical protein